MSHQDYHFDASRSLTALGQHDHRRIEMSQWKWLVAALVPGVDALKKFDAQEEGSSRRSRRRTRGDRTASGKILSPSKRASNQMKAIFVRFGIRAFRPSLRKVERKFKDLRTGFRCRRTRARNCAAIWRDPVLRD